jgi:Alkaline and neutral invertase
MLAESRLQKDGWPEYYDGTLGRYVGKQARKFQTWSIAGYLVSKMLLEDPSNLGMISLGEDKAMKPLIKRSASWTCAKPSKEDT